MDRRRAGRDCRRCCNRRTGEQSTGFHICFYSSPGGRIGGVVVGTLFVVQGQLIACFVSIEENTRETAKRLRAFTSSRVGQTQTAKKSQVSDTTGSHSSI